MQNSRKKVKNVTNISIKEYSRTLADLLDSNINSNKIRNFLISSDHQDHKIKVVRYLRAISLAYLYNGSRWAYDPKNWDSYILQHLRNDDFDIFDACLEAGYVRALIKKPLSRWFISRYIQIDDPIFNNDFMGGIIECGALIVSKRSSETAFRSLRIGNAPEAHLVLNSLPFKGLSEATYYPKWKYLRWTRVPAIDLTYRTDTISFLAGVLSLGMVQKDKKSKGEFTAYNKKAIPILESFGIPIYEKQYVSTMWPALFTPWMPETRRDAFLNSKSKNIGLFACILWRMYVNKSMFVKEGLPYLPSKRTVFNRWGNDQLTTMEFLDSQRRDMGLLSLKPPIDQAVRHWGRQCTRITRGPQSKRTASRRKRTANKDENVQNIEGVE